MSDAVLQFTHDHVALNHRIVVVAGLVRGLQANGVAVGSALLGTLAELRDQLMNHFAREEEGLFPFVAESLPELADRVHSMAIAHDAICGALVRTYHLAARDAEVPVLAAVFERFVDGYAEHSSAEATLLEDLAKRLDEQQRARLASLVEGM